MKKLLMISLSYFALCGCMNQFKFRAENTDTPNAETPVPDNSSTRNPGGDAGGDPGNPKPGDPIVDPDQPPTVLVAYKNGECTQDKFEVSPCLSCQITLKSVPVPISGKASELLDLMTAGCQVRNKSDPAGYQPPTREQILVYLNRGKESLYPTTNPTTRQKNSLSKWLSGDASALKTLFGGLWYRPPQSDDFETYFGIESKEARYLFCYGMKSGSFSNGNVFPLISIDRQRCLSEFNGFGCQEKAEYVQANRYRSQLANVIQLSVNEPFNDSELVPANKCHWQTMSGFYNPEMERNLVDWKNNGYELAVYFERQNPRCEKVDAAVIPEGTTVTIAAKKCQDF